MTSNETKEPNPDWVNAPYEECRIEWRNGVWVEYIVTDPLPIQKDFNPKNYWNGESK